MRVPRTKIYRAFEELDRFGDAECTRFLASALRPWWQRALRELGCAVLGAMVFVVSFAVMVWSVKISGRGFWGSAAFVAIAGVPATLAVFSAAIARDVVLRRRLRQIINTRGSCFACGYSLLGLPVSDLSTVACPECGTVTEVDPAMGELAGGAAGGLAGGRRVVAVTGVAARKFWSAERLRKILKYCRRGGIAVVLLAAVVVLWGIWRFEAANRDAKKAISMLDPIGGMERHIAGLQAGRGERSVPNLYDVIKSMARELDAQEAQFATEFAQRARAIGSNQPVYVDFTVLGRRIAERVDGDVNGAMQQQRREFDLMLAQEAMRRLSGTDFFARVDALAAMERYEPKPSGKIGFAELAALYNECWKVRKITNFCQGRMAMAMASGDSEAAIRAFETGLVVARMSRRGMTGQVVFLELAMLNAVIPLLPRLDEDGLRRIGAIVRPAEGVAPLSAMVETERLVAEQQLYDVFRQADLTCWGAAGVAPLMGYPLTVGTWWSMPGLGGLDENIEELKQAAAGVIAGAAVLPVNRAGLESQLPERSRFIVLHWYPLWRSCKLVLATNDWLMLMRDGVAAMVAIERYLRVDGEYPESLERLVPVFLETAPVDPWSGRALVYRRLAQRDVLGFGFTLYSIGSNGTDEGGVHNGPRAFLGMLPAGIRMTPQGDFVLTENPLGEDLEWTW